MFFSRPAGHKFVHRGDPVSVDFTTGNFVKDDAWHDLDLSSIIPLGTKLVFFRITCECVNAARNVLFRKNGDSNFANIVQILTQISNLNISADICVSPDATRKIEYLVNPDTWDVIDLVVKGWIV